MTPLNFPSSPQVGDTYVFQNRAWRYNGRGWEAYAAPTNAIYNLSIEGGVDLDAGDINIEGDLTFSDANSYVTSISVSTPTANRYILFPDLSGAIAIVTPEANRLTYSDGFQNRGLSTLTTDGTNLTLTGRLTISANSAFSAPPMTLSGTWATGGTSTTTKPTFLIEPSGTTSTSWNTQGTGFGINAPASFSGNLFDCQINGVDKFEVFTTGFRYYNASGANYERGKFAWESNTLRIGTERAGSGVARALELQTDGITQVSIATTGKVSLTQDISVAIGKTYQVNNVQVVGARVTGWGAPTGVATKTAFDTATVTTTELAERVKALIDNLITHGLIGA